MLLGLTEAVDRVVLVCRIAVADQIANARKTARADADALLDVKQDVQKVGLALYQNRWAHDYY